MGEVIEFRNPVEQIIGPIASDPTTADLDRELENFAFSRLPQRERVARILSAAVRTAAPELDATDYLELADRLIPSVNNNFTKPYVFAPQGGVDATA